MMVSYILKYLLYIYSWKTRIVITHSKYEMKVEFHRIKSIYFYIRFAFQFENVLYNIDFSVWWYIKSNRIYL